MTKITHIIPNLTNGVTYYGKVYTANSKKRVNDRADLMVFAAIPSAFPTEPTGYDLIGTYTTSRTWTAPEDGWFKIEVFGASGRGSSAYITEYDYGGTPMWLYASGSGGGGGGYSCSVVQLKEGDSIDLSCGAVGKNTTATVNSSIEVYEVLKVTSGGTDTNPKYGDYCRTGGTGGVGTGGNVENGNGSTGSANKSDDADYDDTVNCAGGKGGNAYHPDGNKGGDGGSIVNTGISFWGDGKAGFIKISRGNTNIVA